MKLVNDFKEYQILDMNNGYKTEEWNGYVLTRPDPQIIWPGNNQNIKVDAKYYRSNSGGGSWQILNNKLPNSWPIHYHDLTFNLKLMGFKHTGLFPEQAYNWNLIMEKVKNANREVKVLNLFAYTGAASVAALKAEVWSIEKDLYNLVDLCSQILSDDAIMFLINSYTTGLSKSVLENILKICVNSKHQGFISSDELGLPMKNSDLVLPCGIYARWEKEKTL